jgi:hypothetical protein
MSVIACGRIEHRGEESPEMTREGAGGRTVKCGRIRGYPDNNYFTNKRMRGKEKRNVENLARSVPMFVTITLISISTGALVTAACSVVLATRLTRALNLHFSDVADSLDRLSDVR